VTPPSAPQLLPAEHPTYDDAIDLYVDTTPGSADTEIWERFAPFGVPAEAATLVVRNVSRPALLPFLPDPALATGAAVIIVPGGGFKFVGMEHEGVTVAQRLRDKGIAAFVLKYRANDTAAEPSSVLQQLGALFAAAGGGQRDGGLSEPRALQDVVAALQLVRERADQWQLDPQRIGLLGFSAGAIAVKRAVLDIEHGARPAFLGCIYGSMLAEDVHADAPPLFAAIALDDRLFGREGFGLIESWQRAGVPVEVHAYERGNHGFGVGTPGTTSTGFTTQFADWLTARGLLTPGRESAS
jgi:acetyl esterase/lipase